MKKRRKKSQLLLSNQFVGEWKPKLLSLLGCCPRRWWPEICAQISIQFDNSMRNTHTHTHTHTESKKKRRYIKKWSKLVKKSRYIGSARRLLPTNYASVVAYRSDFFAGHLHFQKFHVWISCSIQKPAPLNLPLPLPPPLFPPPPWSPSDNNRQLFIDWIPANQNWNY